MKPVTIYWMVLISFYYIMWYIFRHSQSVSSQAHLYILSRCTYLPGYLIEYETAKYPPRLCPSSIIESRPTLVLHCSIDSTNWSSASWASVENRGLLLCPNPSRSRAKMGRCWERMSKFWAQRPTPPPNPWSRTMGVLSLTCSSLKVKVHSWLPLEMGTNCLEKLLSIPRDTKKG